MNDDDAATLIDEFVQTRGELLRAAGAVPPALRTEPFVGRWHLMDLLAHLAGWDHTNVTAIHELQAGRTPAFYQFYEPGWASYNEQLIVEHGTDDWDLLQSRLERSQAEVVALLRALDPYALVREHHDPARPRPTTIAGLLRAAIRDEREHLGEIRGLLRAHGIAGGGEG